jgi:hypothetical protein
MEVFEEELTFFCFEDFFIRLVLAFGLREVPFFNSLFIYA